MDPARWRRPLPILAAGLALAVLATIVWRVTVTPTSTATPRSTVRVGVSDGDLVASYVGQSRMEMERLDADGPLTYALISLSSYLTADRLAAIVPAQAQGVFALARVPLPRRQTELVRLSAGRLPADVTAGMVEVAARKQTDASRYRSLAEIESAIPLRDLHHSNADVSAAEAAAYAAGCACVYAVIVRAPPHLLRTLAGLADVRVVDPAPEVVALERTVFVGLLPEHIDVVGPLPDDALTTTTVSGPSGGSD